MPTPAPMARGIDVESTGDIATAWESYAAAQYPPLDPLLSAAERHAYYAGTLLGLTHVGPPTREQLLAEIVLFGRTVARHSTPPARHRRERCPHGVAALNRCDRCD